MTTAAVLKTPRPSAMPTYLDYGADTLTVTHDGRQAQPLDPDVVQRAAAALMDPQTLTFTRAQVAWLMSQAMRWGYEHRVDEENAAWPAADTFCAGDLFRDLDRKAYRETRDAAARLPRPNDFKGIGDAQSSGLRAAA